MEIPGFWIFSVICLALLGNSFAQEPRIVCYYTNWSVYRNATFNIGNINPSPCSHLIYAYAYISNKNTIESSDSNSDFKQGGYAKFNELKSNNNNLKTLLSIRSKDEQSKFSPLVADVNRRLAFTKNAISFLRKHNFDGLDLNWQHPTYGKDGTPAERTNYAQFVQELRKDFDWESSQSRQTRLLLTVTISSDADVIDQGYDVSKLNKYCDWLNIVTYNYVSASTTNHHAPLYEVKGADPKLNVNFTVSHLISAGADRQKLVIGIPTYGKSYTLLNSSETGIGSPIIGPGKPGNKTAAAGTLAYFEICENIDSNDNWTVVNDSSDNVTGSYSYNGDQWISYNDVKTIRKKARYVVEEELGGVMFWSLDQDDYKGKCSNKPYPLIRAAKEGYDSTKRMVKTGANRNRKNPSKMPSGDSNKNSNKTKLTLDLTKTDFICEDGRYYPHPTDCKKYIYCKSTELSNLRPLPHELTCTANLLFNEKTNNCDYAENVTCSELNTSRLISATTISTPQNNTTMKSSNSLSTGRSITTTAFEDDDRNNIDDPEVINKFLNLIKRTSLMVLEKQLKSSSGNTSLFKLPTTEASHSEVINVIPKDYGTMRSGSQNQRLENREHELQDDNEKEDSNAEAAARNKKPITIHSQHNNVSWIVLFL